MTRFLQAASAHDLSSTTQDGIALDGVSVDGGFSAAVVAAVVLMAALLAVVGFRRS